MAKVVLKNVTKKFDEVVAVDNVNLEIADKEFLVLVGPSGCGKTTTLRMVAGLEEITTGEIFIGDKKINDIPPKDRDIAMVFQSYALYPHMSVYENMAFGLKLRKFKRAEIDRRVKEAAEILHLNELLARLPKQLSGGQRQRVAVGRAIVRQPKVFLMDEPLSNLDAKLRVRMRAELKSLHQRVNTTIIYVTHDQVEAMTLGQRIAVMLTGKLQQADTPLKVYNTPSNSFVAGFIGSPPMNFIEGKIEKAGADIKFLAEGLELKVPAELHSVAQKALGKEVVFGIRPENILTEDRAAKLGEVAQKIEARVDFRELMGSETYIYLKRGPHKLTSRVSTLFDPTVGRTFDMYINMNKMHLFDKTSQEAII